MSSQSLQRLVLISAVLVAIGCFAWQQHSLRKLQAQVALLTASPAGSERESPVASEPVRQPPSDDSRVLDTVVVSPDAGLEARVAALEVVASRYHQDADRLMERGSLPPSDAKLVEWASLFMDQAADLDERIAVLRKLSRNDSVEGQVAQAAGALLRTSTNSSQTRSILESLRGVDDPTVKAATLELARSSNEGRVQESAIRNLRGAVEDPEVEAVLWEVLSSGASGRVEQRAMQALREVPMSDTRAAGLESRAMNTAGSVDERLTALRLLSSGEQDLSRVALAISDAALATADPETLLKYYRAFDDVNDQSFLLPLVHGAEHDNVEVRRRATDALVDYRSEPAIAELLQAMAEGDPDPGVRQQASRVYRNR